MLTINIENCKSAKGRIFVALYNNEKNFLKPEFALQKKVVTITQDKKAIITFENLPYGKYAFAVFHDENNDNKMNFNLVGIPTEGYSFSNNARGFMSSPSFSKSTFEIKTNSYECKIKLSY
jgi:uncharacterized protein (DUF2141 family)